MTVVVTTAENVSVVVTENVDTTGLIVAVVVVVVIVSVSVDVYRTTVVKVKGEVVTVAVVDVVVVNMLVATGIERKLEQNGVAFSSLSKSTMMSTTKHSSEDAPRPWRGEDRATGVRPRASTAMKERSIMSSNEMEWRKLRLLNNALREVPSRDLGNIYKHSSCNNVPSHVGEERRGTISSYLDSYLSAEHEGGLGLRPYRFYWAGLSFAGLSSWLSLSTVLDNYGHLPTVALAKT
jgi:hypothetical protein